ncbi:nucleotide exchange factors-like protein [Thelephora terrestris]|uniref:Nucleotide exchange factors-like protein n=1 Tax=Thelephora terrestris TaxID=56493 RepID=A0A9P6L3H5_9AGAM|nr:nucleotide exchange factors-like protein [Thelephora terrestris]
MALEPGRSGEGLSVQRENCALFLSKNGSDGSSGKEARGPNEGIFVAKMMIGVIYRNINPGIIDHILGKPDTVLMKEALEVALDESRDDDARIQALDDFEMLVEHIDNTSQSWMWDPLQSLLTSQDLSDEIKVHTLWIIGTTVQNNPTAQISYLALKPVPVVISFLSPSVRFPKLRSKAVYALSGLCKHNSRAVKQLDESGGWEALSAALEDSDITVRRKVAFLLNALLIQSDSGLTGETSNLPTPGSSSAPAHPNLHASMVSDPSSTRSSQFAVKALEDRGLLQALVSSLTSPVPHGELDGDPDFEEQVSCAGRFPRGVIRDTDLSAIKKIVAQHPALSERCGMTEDEMGLLTRAVGGI